MQESMFLMAAFVDAFAAVSIAMGLYLLFATNPFVGQALAAATTAASGGAAGA